MSNRLRAPAGLCSGRRWDGEGRGQGRAGGDTCGGCRRPPRRARPELGHGPGGADGPCAGRDLLRAGGPGGPGGASRAVPPPREASAGLLPPGTGRTDACERPRGEPSGARPPADRGVGPPGELSGRIAFLREEFPSAGERGEGKRGTLFIRLSLTVLSLLRKIKAV